MTHAFRLNVWEYPGMAGWHFVTLPKKASAEIKRRFAVKRPGFGSIRVEATVGKTTWKTSIFPDSKAGAYILPIKAQVRKREGILKGKAIALSLFIIG
jgi:hypothetical protein